MPELPEVETVRRIMRRVLQGKRIRSAKVMPDEIVCSGCPPESFQERLEGSIVREVGRKGKFWWLEFDDAPWLFGHLGMSGWIRELGGPSKRLHSHGEAPLDDADGNPRFLKMLIEAEDGSRIAFTDGRRLGRLWLAEAPHLDRQIQRLGPDVFEDLPSAEELYRKLSKRKPAIKAVLLDQSLFAGVGNWIADEVLYQSRIAPQRSASSLSQEEVARLRESIVQVVGHAVEVGADHKRYPDTWMFGNRWGGKRGAEEIEGRKIARETIGGRTTAWVPEVQK